MTYDPGTPQASDIPAASQGEFFDNFLLLNQFFGNDHIPFGNVITSATNAFPVVCKSPNHGLTSGNTITVSHMCYLNQDGILEPWPINGGPYVVTVIDPNTFSFNQSSVDLGTYYPNSGAFVCQQFNYGFHTKNYFPFTQVSDPNLAPPYSSFYPKTTTLMISTKTVEVPNLFFNNGVGSSFVSQLTQIPFRSTKRGIGFKSPWGITFNMGQVQLKGVNSSTAVSFSFPMPFSSTPFMIIISKMIEPVGLTLLIFDLTTTEVYIKGIPAGVSTGNPQISYIAIGI